MQTWEIAGSKCSNLFVTGCLLFAVLPVISVTGSGYCSNSVAKYYSCKLLSLADEGAITLWKQHQSGVKDNAYAYNNIRDTCNGKAASRSNYNCFECRDPGAPGGSVNEIAGACHSCTSKHYLGRAVDLHNPPEQNDTMIRLCSSFNGTGLDEKTHVHCQFPY